MSNPFIRAIALTDKTAGLCTATINGVNVVVQVARDLALFAGDAFLVAKAGSEWVAIQRLGTAAPVPIDAPGATPPPTNPTQKGTLVVAPVETRSYRSGSWRTDNDDVYQGQFGGNGNHTGVAFMGSKARSLAGATVTKATIRVRRPDAGGANAAQATTLRLVTQATRPSGAPTLGSSTSGPSLRRGQTTDAFVIPTSWAQAMVDGTAGGLGFFVAGGSPYVILAGRSTWSAAFTMTISWTR